MYFNFKTSTFALSLSLLLSVAANAQIAVTPSSTATALATALTGGGVTISSPVLNCDAQSNGTYTVTPGTLIGTSGTVWGINNGIVLSTGRVSSSGGSAATLASFNTGAAGDPALSTLAMATTYDACILEFDIVPTGDTIKFDYIFGSEEYNNSTCGNYNDAFAFFISGPGISGLANMALVPGTNIPVTVNSVNNGVPGAGFTLANCTAMGAGSPFTAYYDDNNGGANFTMRGFTKVFTAMHDVIPCNTYHLKITIADAGNHLYDSEVFIKQGSIVSAAYTNNASVCVGGTITVTATPAGGTWTSSDVTIATVDAVTGDVQGISAGTANLTYTTGAGCYKVTSLAVNPIPTLTGASSVCRGLSTSLSASPSGGTWSGGVAGIATISASGIGNGINIGVVPLVYTSPAGCVLNTTFSVFNLPAITGVLTVCEGSVTTLSDAMAGGTWSSVTTSVATVTNTGGGIGVVGGVSGGTSVITYTMGSTCYSTATVTVNPRPALPVTAPVRFCQNTTPTSLSATGTSLLWYTGVTGGTGTPVAPTPGTTLVGFTTYYVTQTNGNGCESSRAPLVVTIDPALTFTITGDTLACPKDTLTFNFTGIIPATADYAWTLPSGTSLYPGSSLTGPSISVINHNTTNSTVALHIVDLASGCSGDDDAIIYVDVPPAAVVFTQEDICLRDTVHLGLSDHSDDAYLYTWLVDGVPMSASPVITTVAHSSNSGGPFRVSWNTPGVHVVSVQSISNGGHCPSEISTDTVKVHELPDAQLTFKAFRDVPCIDDSIYFASRSYVTANTYEWAPEHSFNNRSGHEAWAMLDKRGATDFVLTVTDPFGCKASTTTRIMADGCCRVTMPTAFTPNNDGKNDVFRPIFADQGRPVTGGSITDTLDSYHRFSMFRVQNRWGQTVFETTNNYPVWDGTYAGVPQDMGVYFYVLIFDCDDRKVTQSGDVTLIR